MTSNEILQTIAPVISLKMIEGSILPILDKLVADDIPNIRFNVAKSYGVLIETLRRLPADRTLYEVEKAGETPTADPRNDTIIREQVLPNLEKLQQDEDVDVRYFATTAGAKYTEPLQTSA